MECRHESENLYDRFLRMSEFEFGLLFLALNLFGWLALYLVYILCECG